eukprot:179154_1
MANTNKQSLSLIESFGLGVFSKIISTSMVAPLDRVKLVVQCQSEMIKSGSLKMHYPYNSTAYSGPIDCFTSVIKNEGVTSLWRGNYIACLRKCMPTEILNYFFKERIKNAFQLSSTDTFFIRITKNSLSGGIGGAISLSLLYSMDFVRTRLANDMLHEVNGDKRRKYSGTLDVYKQTLKTDGIIGLYRGFMVSCVGIIVYTACYFGLYDTMKPNNDSFIIQFGVGYCVTMTAGIITYPFDTVRRRMMMRSGESDKYKGAMHCAKQIYVYEGLMSFMRGVSVTIFKSFAGATTLVLFDTIAGTI